MILIASGLIALTALAGAQDLPAAASRDETVHRAWCGASTVAVIYGNSAKRIGSVRSVRLDDREVPAAAAELTRRVGQRDIDQIEFLTCGFGDKPRTVKAMLHLGEAASSRRALPPLLSFSIDRNGIRFP